MVTDFVVEKRKLFVILAVIATIAMVPAVLGIQLDRTLRSAYVTSSPAYYLYKYFLEVFGSDEFVLITLKGEKPANDSSTLKTLQTITTKLEQFPEITEVVSIANLKVFQNRKGILGNYPLLVNKGDELHLPDRQHLDKIREALPLTDYLLSQDLRTVGILVQIDDRWKFDPLMGAIQARIAKVVREHMPPGSDVRLLGAPVIRESVQQLTIRTAFMFGLLCTLVVMAVTLYIFKSLRVAGIATLVVGLAVYWIIGIMSLVGIPLNSTTSLTFGLILVVSVATVIHIVAHYYHSGEEGMDREEAVKESLRVVGRPALMCTLTTSVAFATIMVSSIPMVQQLGLVMSFGVLLSFLLSMAVTPALLIALKPVDRRTFSRMSGDWVAWIFQRLERFVFSHYRGCAIGGVVFALMMLAGAPFIRIDTQVLRLFVNSSDVWSGIRFAEENLTPVNSLEVVVEGDERTFKDPESWKKMATLQKELREIPEVASLDSPLPLFQYLVDLLSKPGAGNADLLSDRRLLSQVMLVMSLNREGKTLLRKYLDDKFSRAHISVRIKNSGARPIGQIIDDVRDVAERVMEGTGKVIVTGEAVVFSDQASEVVRSQILSLFLALVSITLLMTIQLRSWSLGLVSLIPNVMPIIAIFGVMGWTGISLDNVTVFAAAIAIGLSVDDTIHYLTQLKREMTAQEQGLNPDIETGLRRAYQTTAKALISTSLALFFGFLVLAVTPTRPAINFGFLGSAAIVVALLGDLAFMPAVILTFPGIRRLVNREVQAHPISEPSTR